MSVASSLAARYRDLFPGHFSFLCQLSVDKSMVPALAVPVLGVVGVDLLSLEGVGRLKIFGGWFFFFGGGGLFSI